ncbi:MAG TPA: sulfurtransferase [Acidimicrobiia bacterium]|nr:sulfurtransferase [Acidimicrobiia bacterium]
MPGPLIGVFELQQSLDEVKLFDLRWSLTSPTPGRESYETGHIPGAVFVDLDRDLAGDQGDGRHPLPHISEFVDTLGRLGLEPEDDVVVYDDMSGTVAARMWWMLESIGHPGRVRVLDGGLDEWVKRGLTLESGSVTPARAVYPEVAGFTGAVRHDDLEGRFLADVRSPERYRGEVEPVDPKAGHVPGAVNYPVSGNLHDGRFRASSDLAEVYRDFPEDGVVSCGSGVNACHGALALVIAGKPMPDVYIGSFSDWSRRDLPVATGPNP